MSTAISLRRRRYYAHSMRRAIFAAVLLALSTGNAVANYARWTWAQRLPAQLTTNTKRSKRTPEAVDRFFHGPPYPPSVQQVLDFLGLPDGFSSQFMYSKTEGTAKPSRAGGTLRFLLDDGGEVHVWTPDYHVVGLAIRHRKTGGSELLYK